RSPDGGDSASPLEAGFEDSSAAAHRRLGLLLGGPAQRDRLGTDHAPLPDAGRGRPRRVRPVRRRDWQAPNRTGAGRDFPLLRGGAEASECPPLEGGAAPQGRPCAGHGDLPEAAPARGWNPTKPPDGGRAYA